MKAIKLAGFILMILAFVATAFAEGVQRIDKDALKENMGSYIIVDFRTGSDWKGSEFKILGAVRPKGNIVDFAKSKGWAKDAKIVFYCA
ncbi:hypothetical protein SAMN02745161_0897 [Halodesulfovibrio marinisediminis DSM 17456]|uniref:Rhodanese-like domain-containing protein n=2 Tax=Halodesulfovibrio marinisediminis TaxID=458711 RepID=A0A1N6ECS1_9BACT|nr:hypothetical protein SAMN02745161_0897 [Halodesulfovibrio marinisediminis DSM 17456]